MNPFPSASAPEGEPGIRPGVTSGKPFPRTVTAYRRRAGQLMRRCLKDTQETSKAGGAGDRPVTDLAFVDWLVGRKAGWAPASWRQNKAAVCHAFRHLIATRTARLGRESDPAVIARITTRIALTERALDRLRAEGSQGCASATERTSATKAKLLPEAERLAIVAAATAIGSRYAGDLDDGLLVGVRTGLRPSEWAGTRALPRADGALVLVVPNGKADAERAHGPTRTLTFTALPAAERAAILRWIERVRAAGPAYPALQTALGDLLHTLTRRLWPRRRRHPTLYSARHQFAALAKLILDPDEVAALMGHATDRTATTHYGRYRSGQDLPPELLALTARLPRPAPEEVARIRARLEASLARLPALRERTMASMRR